MERVSRYRDWSDYQDSLARKGAKLDDLTVIVAVACGAMAVVALAWVWIFTGTVDCMALNGIEHAAGAARVALGR
jgi:hypothetical protein